MSSFEVVEIPENAVIVLYNMDLPDAPMDELFADLHHHFPKNLVMALSGDKSLEARPLDELKFLLQSLTEHEEALRG